MYDYIIVGAGIAGISSARILADKGNKILIIDKRGHIGGNCYDEYDENGVLIHTYGPHIFHTNNEAVFKFLSKFTDWYLFRHEVVANINDSFIPVPFNFNSLYMVFDENTASGLKDKLIEKFGNGARVSILDLINSDDKELKIVADYVYDNIFKFYTMKQWGKTLEELDPSVGNRVPIVLSHENGYFADKYQGVPKDGFYKMFENMSEHENIDLRLNADAKSLFVFTENSEILFDNTPFSGKVIYTGALDELFDFKFGELPYRSLDFKFEHYDVNSYIIKAVVNYTVSEDYTRITEFKKLTGQEIGGTTIMKEYPKKCSFKDGDIPYYAINNASTDALYNEYLQEALRFKNLILLGRLADYKYYNIDKMVEIAMDKFL